MHVVDVGKADFTTKPEMKIFNSLETYRFKEEDDYEYKIWLYVFSRILKIWTPRKASFYHFSLEQLALLP